MSKISFAIKNPSFAAEGKSAKAVRTPGCPKAGAPCPGQRKIKKRLAIAGFTTSKRRHQQARFPRGNVHNAECQSFFLISSQSPSFLLDGIIIQDEGEVVKGNETIMRNAEESTMLLIFSEKIVITNLGGVTSIYSQALNRYET